jgi:anti-anti-sigma regulatory factor
MLNRLVFEISALHSVDKALLAPLVSIMNDTELAGAELGCHTIRQVAKTTHKTDKIYTATFIQFPVVFQYL